MTEWKRVKIGELFNIEKGVLQSSKCEQGEYPFITAATEWKTHNQYSHDCEALIYAVAASGSLGRIHYIKGKFISSDLCFILTEKNHNEYPIDYKFYHLIFEFMRDEIVSATKTGTSKEAINRKNFSEYEIPYIPFEKQKKNVDLLVNSKKLTEAFLSEISEQKDLIKKLRQSILQDAIEGKLTEDWRKENPLKKGDINFDAEALFEKIQEEKNKQEKGNKKKKDNGKVPVVGDDERMIEIPGSWKWVQLKQISNIGTGATPLTSTKEYYENGTIPWINSSATSQEYVLEPSALITEKALRETNCSINPVGTLVVAMYGQGKTRGQITELKIEASTNQACATIQLIWENIILRKYVKLVFKKMYEEIRSLAQGGAQPNLNLSKISDTVFPLPPLAEQNEIVRQVENRLAKVEQLEQQVQERENLTKSLFRGILKNAFEGEVSKKNV